MAMAFTTVWLLLLSSLFLLPIYVLAQTNGSVAVGASLSAAGNSSWISPSGDFAFGFRQLENNDLYFLLSIWFAKIRDKTIVWYTNGDKPAPKGSTVNLTANSGLVLTSPQGEELWRSETIVGVVAYGLMNDVGNFVLESDKSEKLWETFKNPTDTMLPGQIMEKGGKLFSRQSETNYARGRFLLALQQEDGNLVFSAQKPYYSTKTTTGTVPGSEGKRLVFNDSGNFYILRANGGKFTFTEEERPAGDYYLRSTLNFDGVLAQYFFPKRIGGNVSWKSLWSRPDNICQEVDLGTGVCGDNSICTLNAVQRPTCECPKGYSLRDPNDSYGSCKQDFRQGCENERSYSKDLYDVQMLTNTDWLTPGYEQLNASTADKCNQSCIEDCLCDVATYSNETCWKKKFPLSYGREDSTLNSKTFIKFRNDNSARQVPDDKKKSRTTCVHVGSVLLGAAVICLGFFLIFQKKHAINADKTCVASNYRHITFMVKATEGFKVSEKEIHQH